MPNNTDAALSNSFLPAPWMAKFAVFCKLVNIENNLRNVEFFESFPGRIVLYTLFAFVIGQTRLAYGGFDFAITLASAICAYSGRYRGRVMPLLTLGMLCLYASMHDGKLWQSDLLVDLVVHKEGMKGHIDLKWLRYCTFSATLLFSIGVIYCAGKYKNVLPFRKPIASLLLLFFTLLLIANSGILHGMAQILLWSFIHTLGILFCFLGYALIDQRSKNPSPLLFQLGTFYPFWGSSWVPFGKGAAYLRKVEVKTRKDLSIAQIKATRLLIWCYFLQSILTLCQIIIYDHYKLPLIEQIFSAQMMWNPYPWYISWASLIMELFVLIVGVTAGTGAVVACARMSGYQILQHVQNPLQSETVAEFWNRYSFYLKEVLVEFFFYPTFIRYFRHHERLRIFFATFMAACVGNILLHFIANLDAVVTLGFFNAIIAFSSYALYALILASAIATSQITRQKNKKPTHWWFPQRIITSIRIILFFCILRVWEQGIWRYTFQEHLYVFLHLFGLK